MYESYTYDQIKALPDDQKTEALKELIKIYPTNKELAEYLDVAPIVTSNMVKKFVEGIQVGRKAMTPEEKAQKKAEREEEKLKQLQEQQTKENESKTKSNEEVKDETKDEVKPEPELKVNSFSIQLDKNMIGEEAIVRLNGISNSLLKDKEYKVNLVVEEV